MAEADESVARVDAGQAGTSDADKGADGQGSNTGTSDPFSGLDTGTREWIGTKGYKSVGDLAKAALNAESLIGRSVQIPGDDAKPEDWDKVFRRLGAPEKADGYEFKKPDGLPDGFKYDEDFAKSFREVAHKIGLPKKQAAALHDFYVTASLEAEKAEADAKTATAEAASDALAKAIGTDRGSDDWKKGVALISQTITEFGGTALIDELKAEGLLRAEDGALLSAKLGEAFYKIGKKLFPEGSIVRGEGSADVDNPFKEGPDKGNLTAQSMLIKSDRPKALRLIRAAGHKPSDWGLPDAA